MTDAQFLAHTWKLIKQHGYDFIVENGDIDGIDFVADRVLSAQQTDGTDKEIIALKAMLKMVEFSDQKCCPVCGGNQHHDSTCLLAASIYPEFAESYKRLSGGDTVRAAMLWNVNNRDEYKFLLPQNAAQQVIAPDLLTLG